MASIRERNGRWQVQIRTKDVFETKTFASEQQALDYVRTIDNQISTTQYGLVSELLISARLTGLGYNVSTPIGVCRYDLVYEKDGKFKRVQIKSATKAKTNGAIKFNAYSSSGGLKKLYSAKDIDEFMIMYKDKVYVIPIDCVHTHTVTLRINKSKNNQLIGCVDASKYELL